MIEVFRKNGFRAENIRVAFPDVAAQSGFLVRAEVAEEAPVLTDDDGRFGRVENVVVDSNVVDDVFGLIESLLY